MSEEGGLLKSGLRSHTKSLQMGKYIPTIYIRAYITDFERMVRNTEQRKNLSSRYEDPDPVPVRKLSHTLFL